MNDMRRGDDEDKYDLAKVLGQLAYELEMANKRVVVEGRPGLLRWTEATVELGVTWEKKGDGEVNLQVVKLGGGLTKENTTTITVKVVPVESEGDASAKGGRAKDPRHDKDIVGDMR